MLKESEIWRRAIALAKRGLLTCTPNPAVGAVIVRNSQILGQGYHHRAGGPHAEIMALRDAKKKGHKVKGATIYVTLEPCSTFGRTPPCTKAIIEAGLKKVCIGALDPNPRHQGAALKILRSAGLEAQVASIPACAEINRRFNHYMQTGLPFVHLKWAMSLDGKIACASGASQWISNEKSRRAAHELRALYDGVLIGAGTLEKDGPALSVRLPRINRQPCKIVLDSRARLSYEGRILKDTPPEKIIVATGCKAPKKRIQSLRQKGLTVIETSTARTSVRELLVALGKMGLSGILVEGGPAVQQSFLKEHLANRLTAFIAPCLLGGAQGLFPLPLAGKPDEGKILANISFQRLWDDIRLDADILSGGRHED